MTCERRRAASQGWPPRPGNNCAAAQATPSTRRPAQDSQVRRANPAPGPKGAPRVFGRGGVRAEKTRPTPVRARRGDPGRSTPGRAGTNGAPAKPALERRPRPRPRRVGRGIGIIKWSTSGRPGPPQGSCVPGRQAGAERRGRRRPAGQQEQHQRAGGRRHELASSGLLTKDVPAPADHDAGSRPVCVVPRAAGGMPCLPGSDAGRAHGDRSSSATQTAPPTLSARDLRTPGP